MPRGYSPIAKDHLARLGPPDYQVTCPVKGVWRAKGFIIKLFRLESFHLVDVVPTHHNLRSSPNNIPVEAELEDCVEKLRAAIVLSHHDEGDVRWLEGGAKQGNNLPFFQLDMSLIPCLTDLARMLFMLSRNYIYLFGNITSRSIFG